MEYYFNQAAVDLFTQLCSKNHSHPAFCHLPEDVQTFLVWTLTLTMSSSYAGEYPTQTHTHRAQLQGLTVISDNRSPHHTALALSSLSASVPSGEFCSLWGQERPHCGQALCALPSSSAYFLTKVEMKTMNMMQHGLINYYPTENHWYSWNSWPVKILTP